MEKEYTPSKKITINIKQSIYQHKTHVPQTTIHTTLTLGKTAFFHYILRNQPILVMRIYLLLCLFFAVQITAFTQNKDSVLVAAYLKHVENMDSETFYKQIQETKDSIYPYAEIDRMPEFPGGLDSLYAYLKNNAIIPRNLQTPANAGRVFIQFLVNKHGKVKHVDVLRGPHPEINTALRHVIADSPQWTPGLHQGNPVTVKYLLPLKLVY